MYISRHRVAAVTGFSLACFVSGIGCTANPSSGGLLGGEERRVQPDDFIGAPDDATSQTTVADTSDGSALRFDTTPPSRDRTNSAGDAAASNAVTMPPRVFPDDALPVDGMIGQINGRPVFADDVLADLADTLAAKGRQLNAAEFQDQAKAEITQAVRATLQSRLILAEAERALAENEWAAVRYMREQQRDTLLRKHGLGSLKATDRVLREETGRGLEETLVRFQEGVITRTYLNQNLNALINVTRRDIVRFYQENLDRFQPEPVRDLTIIVTDTPEAADLVQAELNKGVAFSEIAAGPLNRLTTDGTMPAVKGDRPFDRPEIETPMVAAEEGAWFGPVRVDDGRQWFVKVDRVERAPHVSLEDAQASIEAALREQQQRLRTEQFLARLSDQGNFTEPEEMVDALTSIAMSRYATP
ncbi:MAG: peptidylprolyl isomerase [Planctomycetota bacterium]